MKVSDIVKVKKTVWLSATYHKLPDPGDPIHMGHLYPHQTGPDDIPFAEIPYTAWGDYVGGTVQRANHQGILEDYKGLVDIGILWNVIGHYSSHSLVIRLDADIPDEDTARRIESLADAIAELDNCPAYDDERISQVEDEILNESIESWVRDDIRRLMDKDEAPTAEQVYQAIAECDVWQDFIYEDAVSAYINDDSLRTLGEYIYGEMADAG